MFIIYTPNSRLVLAVLDWEREQGFFGGSTEGAKGEQQRGRGKQGRTLREEHEAVEGRSTEEPELTASKPRS